MKNILKNRLALSTVVTTLIILVVSVLLAGVVTYLAINVVSTRSQEEDLQLTKQHVWYDTAAPGVGQAAVLVINTGGRDVVIDKITCRGQASEWADVFYNVTTAAISDDLEYVSGLAAGDITIGSANYTLVAATTDLTLKSGYTAIIYVNSPDSISMNDIGLTVSLTLFTSQAMHYKEANVEAVVA